MGLLSSITKAIASTATKAVTTIAKVATPALNTLSAVYTHPIKTISAIVSPTKTVAKDVVAPYVAQPTAKRITETLTTAAGYATAVIGVGAVAGAAKAGTLASSAAKLIPATTKGKVAAAVAAPIAIGIVANQPIKSLEAVTGAPSALANFGGNVANVAADPSIAGILKTVKENPFIVGTLAAGGTIIGLKTIIPAISSARTTAAIKEQTEVIKEAAASEKTAVMPTEKDTGLLPEKTLPTSEEKPLMQETTTITTGRKRHRRATIKEKPSVRQSIKILVQNRATSTGMRINRTSERYINERSFNL